MKKIIIFLIPGFIFLAQNLFGEKYDTITRKDGSNFEMFIVPQKAISLGKYQVPEELSEQEAKDIIMGKVKTLQKSRYLGTIIKDNSFLNFKDCYLLKTYTLASSCDGILSSPKPYQVTPYWFGLLIVSLLCLILPSVAAFFLGVVLFERKIESLRRSAFLYSYFIFVLILSAAFGLFMPNSGMSSVLSASIIFAALSALICNSLFMLIAVLFADFLVIGLSASVQHIGEGYFGIIECLAIFALVSLASFSYWQYWLRKEKSSEDFVLS